MAFHKTNLFHSAPENLQDMSESFHPDDQGTGASTSQESLEASPAPAEAASESEVEGNVQESLHSCLVSLFPFSSQDTYLIFGLEGYFSLNGAPCC